MSDKHVKSYFVTPGLDTQKIGAWVVSEIISNNSCPTCNTEDIVVSNHLCPYKISLGDIHSKCNCCITCTVKCLESRENVEFNHYVNTVVA